MESSSMDVDYDKDIEDSIFGPKSMAEELKARRRADIAVYWMNLTRAEQYGYAHSYMEADDIDGAVEAIAKAYMAQDTDGGTSILMGGAIESEYGVLARLVYIGVLDESRFLKPFESLSWEDMILLGLKSASVFKNPGERLSAVMYDYKKEATDLKAMRDLGVAKPLIRNSLARPVAADQYAFSANYWQHFLGVKGTTLNEVRDSANKLIGHTLTLPRGEVFSLKMNPVTAAPGYIVDHVRFGDVLQTYAGTDARVKVLRGGWGLFEMVAYVMQNIHFKYETVKGIVCTTARVEGENNYFTKAQMRQVDGEKLLTAVRALVKGLVLPPNLNSHTNVATLVHYILDLAVNDDPSVKAIEESVDKTFASRHCNEIKKALSSWAHYESITAFARDINSNSDRPVMGIGDACARLADRRRKESANAQYNALFDGTDTSIHGFQVPEKAASAKFFPVCAKIRELLNVDKIDIDVYSLGSGAALPAILKSFPRAEVVGYDATKRRDAKVTIHDGWDIHKKFCGSGAIMLDNSYGIGENISETNKFKVGYIIDRMKNSRPYVAGAVKFYCDESCKMQYKNEKLSLPYDMQELAYYYESVTLMAPTKAHSPEMFVVFGKPKEYGAPANFDGLYIPFLAKVALLDIANKFRTACYVAGSPVPFGPGMATYLKPSFWADLLLFTGLRNVPVAQIGEFQGFFETKKGKKISFDETDGAGYNFEASISIHNEMRQMVADMYSVQLAIEDLDDDAAGPDVDGDSAMGGASGPRPPKRPREVEPPRTDPFEKEKRN